MNAYIYHHNDDDGFCAGAIIYELCEKKYNPEEIISYEVDYHKQFDFSEIKNNDLVFFVDYSFSNKSNIKALKELIRKMTTGKVVWLDHHQTSKDLIDGALEPGGLLEGIDGIFGVKESGNATIILNHRFYARIDMNICGAYISYLYAIEKMGYLNSYALDSVVYIPMFIKYINSYDIWAMNMENTKEFHTGMMFKNNDISCYFDGICDNGGILGNRITPLLDPTRHITERYIKDGMLISKYNQIQYKKMRSIFSFPCGITIMTDTGKKKYDCLALNAPNILGSSVFDDAYDKYDIVILFNNNGENYQYSLYSSNKDIRCDEIAKSFGGGGHKGAAGFYSNELLFHKDGVFNIDTRDPETEKSSSHNTNTANIIKTYTVTLFETKDKDLFDAVYASLLSDRVHQLLASGCFYGGTKTNSILISPEEIYFSIEAIWHDEEVSNGVYKLYGSIRPLENEYGTLLDQMLLLGYKDKIKFVPRLVSDANKVIVITFDFDIEK